MTETLSTHPTRKPTSVSEAPPTTVPHIRSDALFTNGNILLIEHNGTDYVLRKTRNGKLILTK